MTIGGAESLAGPRFDNAGHDYDALLLLSFGGPDGVDDVLPFLERVTGGRGVPRERLLEVAEHYYHFGGRSPINDQNRALIAALEAEFTANGLELPIYFGNRNWHPLVEDTVRQMRDAGVRRALVFATSAYSSYSGCRQYREDVLRALDQLGDSSIAFDKIRVFYNHPGFVAAMADRVREAVATLPAERQASARLVFTAHSIPMSMARGCAYEAQLAEASNLVAAAAGFGKWDLAYQSRSGSPHTPWLEPDISDHLDQLRDNGIRAVVVCPIGFTSDHLEVLFDLDEEAAAHAASLGMSMARSSTAGTHPAFVRMIHDLVVERMTVNPERPCLGVRGPNHDICPVNCCLSGATRTATATVVRESTRPA